MEDIGGEKLSLDLQHLTTMEEMQVNRLEHVKGYMFNNTKIVVEPETFVSTIYY